MTQHTQYQELNIITRSQLCEYNCGNLANYLSPSNKACCSNHFSKCPVVKKNRKSVKIYTTNLCSHGCGNLANYMFKSGKICCSEHVRKCPEIIKTQKKTYTNVDAFGDSSSKRQAEKAKLSNLRISEKDGLNSYQRGHKLRVENMKNDIDKTGLNAHQRANRKSIKTKTETIGVDGLNINQRALLNRRVWKSRKFFYENTNLLCESFNERNWLNNVVLLKGIEYLESSVTRGPVIKYFDPPTKKMRNYFSDFYISETNTIYEIKSSWYFKDKSYEMFITNLAKLRAAKMAGYNVILVLDGKEIPWEIHRSLCNIPRLK